LIRDDRAPVTVVVGLDSSHAALRALRQDRLGVELTERLREDESVWLDAKLG
jgi:hypothetical protein